MLKFALLIASQLLICIDLKALAQQHTTCVDEQVAYDCAMKYPSFQNGLKNCNVKSTDKNGKSCIDAAKDGQCILDKIPHESPDEIQTVLAFHQCIHYPITEEQVQKLNAEQEAMKM